MSSKGDFLDWDDSDINLDLLLGEYTVSDLDSDENEQPAKKVKKCAAKSVYQCPECDNSYSSVSGFRGHLRKKHSLQNVKLSDHRSSKEGNVKPKDTSFSMTEPECITVFDSTIDVSLDEIINCPFRNSSKSSNGKSIVELAKMVKSSLREPIADILRTPFVNAVKSTESCRNNDMSANEQLFNSFYCLTSDNDIQSQLVSTIRGNLGEVNLPIKLFVSILEDAILKNFMTERAKFFSKKSSEPSAISDIDQSIVFHISGYIISALKKDMFRHKKNPKHQELNRIMTELADSNSHQSKSYVEKFKGWTNKLDRGGLVIPCDNFFLLVREFEQCYRKLVDVNSISSLSLDRTTLVNSILTSYMVNHYWDQLCGNSDLKEFALEKCLRLFLTVRGFSTARQVKLMLQAKKETTAKPLRQALKDKSNRVN